MLQDNLTAKQNDYAVFLPAISGFYATFLGRYTGYGTDELVKQTTRIV